MGEDRGRRNTSLRRGSRGDCSQSINLASPCFLQPPSPSSCAPTALSGRPGTCRFGPAGPYGSDGIHRCWRSCGIGCRACHGKCPDQRLQWGKLGACSVCGPAGERENAGEMETVFAQGYKGNLKCPARGDPVRSALPWAQNFDQKRVLTLMLVSILFLAGKLSPAHV